MIFIAASRSAASCNKTLDTGKCEGHGGEVYCSSCYAKSFGPKGYGFASSMIAAEPNRHFHVKSAVTQRATAAAPRAATLPRNDLLFSGSTSSTPMSPLSPKSAASSSESPVSSSHSLNNMMIDAAPAAAAAGEHEYQPYTQYVLV